MNPPSHLIRALAAVFALSFGFATSSAQNCLSSEAAQNGAVLIKLSPMAYPPLARMTRVTGDVVLIVTVRNDGSVESAVVVSGHPLLSPAALSSAMQSRFACRGCGDNGASSQFVYTFQLVDDATGGNLSDAVANETLPRVVLSPNHVTVVDRPVYLSDPGPDRVKVRSAKCLYLWRCANPRLIVFE